MSVTEIAGLFVIPALVGALSGWIYWRAAGRPPATRRGKSAENR